MKNSSNNVLYALALWLVAVAAIVLAFVFFHGWQSFVAGFVGGVGMVFGFVKLRS
jgi:uncharacterized membrane protein